MVENQSCFNMHSFFYWVHICFPLSGHFVVSFFCPLKFHRQVIKPEYREPEDFGVMYSHSRWAAAPTHTHTALLTMFPRGWFMLPGQLFLCPTLLIVISICPLKWMHVGSILFLLLLLPLGLCISCEPGSAIIRLDSGLWFYFLLLTFIHDFQVGIHPVICVISYWW